MNKRSLIPLAAVFLIFMIAALVVYGGLNPDAGSPAASPTPRFAATYNNSARFEYFILALSWEPEYCATSGSGDVQECAAGKKLGFVLHGLWPQYQNGYPSSCSLEKLSPAVQTRYAGLFPSQGLMAYEWEKHGTCSGLAPESYLALVQQLKESVAAPATFNAPGTSFRITPGQIRQAFSQMNPFLSEASIEMNCSESGQYLKEVYLCFGLDGNPAACGYDIHKDTLKSCQAADFSVRQVH